MGCVLVKYTSEHQNSNFNQKNNFKLLRLGAKCVGGGAAACVVVMVCSLWLPSIIETTIWWVMEPVKPTGANLQHPYVVWGKVWSLSDVHPCGRWNLL